MDKTLRKRLISDKIKITKLALDKILSYFDVFSYEMGGALGIKGDVITMFYPLENEDELGGCFIPSLDSLNSANDYFANHDVDFGGIIHSHPVSKFGSGQNRPSNKDIDFYRNFINANKQFDKLIFPIITLVNDEKVINWFIFENDELFELEIEII